MDYKNTAVTLKDYPVESIPVGGMDLCVQSSLRSERGKNAPLTTVFFTHKSGAGVRGWTIDYDVSHTTSSLNIC